MHQLNSHILIAQYLAVKFLEKMVLTAKTQLLHFIIDMQAFLWDTAYVLTAVKRLQILIKMILKLKDIATVSAGMTFRSRIKASTRGGNIRLIQMKDLGDDNLVHLNDSLHIDHAQPKSNYLVKRGDIIFRSRGQTNTAALLQENTENTIVAAPLFRMRPNIKKIVPEFLLWWINQPSSQSYLASRSEGTMVKMISKQVLEDLEVTLPTLEQQRKIANFFSLLMQERQLLEKIQKRKVIYTQGILMQMASESRPTASNKNPGFDTVTSISGQTQSKNRS